MWEALAEAQRARDMGEVPVGAVIVHAGRIIGRGCNRTKTDGDPTAHAEMIAIRQAAAALGGWRLLECEMYVTTEPCCMCAGAIVLARIEKLYIGTMEPKSGACGSLYDIVRDDRLNHRVEVETGLLQAQCSEMLVSFFREVRTLRKAYGKRTDIRLEDASRRRRPRPQTESEDTLE